jgi:hypothetical protein
MNKLNFFIIAFAVASCDEGPALTAKRLEMQREFFLECMNAAGIATDGDIVRACNSRAAYLEWAYSVAEPEATP